MYVRAPAARARYPWGVARLAHALQYAAVRFAEALVRSFPPAALPFVARAAGWCWWALDGRRRERARENLRVAFGAGLDDTARRALVRRSFASLLGVPLEVLLQPRLLSHPADLRRRVRLLGDWDQLRSEVAAGGGGLIVTGHLGNWELAGRCLRLLGVPAQVVVRPIENPWLDAHASRARGGAGSVITKRGAARGVLAALRSGRWVALLADQNAGVGGVFVPFFGLEASTPALPAVLALRNGAPLYLGACLRASRGPLTYDIHLRRLEVPRAVEPSPEAVRTLLSQATRTLESWIRLVPDQYNWLHRRWKRRPAGEVPGPHLPAYARPRAP